MDAHEIARMLSDSLDIAVEVLEDDIGAVVPDGIDRLDLIHTYEEDGILTRDAGFVLHMTDNTSFQVTVVRSR